MNKFILLISSALLLTGCNSIDSAGEKNRRMSAYNSCIKTVMKSGYEELKEKRKDAPAYCAKVAYELFPDHRIESNDK